MLRRAVQVSKQHSCWSRLQCLNDVAAVKDLSHAHFTLSARRMHPQGFGVRLLAGHQCSALYRDASEERTCLPEKGVSSWSK